MFKFPIGVMVESFKIDFRSAVKKAADIGASGVQMYVTFGEYSYKTLTDKDKKEILDIVKSNGLVFTALCGDLGHGFWKQDMNPSLIEEFKCILQLAKELETDIVTTHIGVIPEDINHPRYKVMQEACHRLGEYAEGLGAYFAVETGPETAETLKIFLDSLDTKGAAVNLDPANLVMVPKDDPVKAVYTLKDYIVHTHAKDGKNLIFTDAEVVYGVREDKNVKNPVYVELPLGEGDVNFPDFLLALSEIGYEGFLTIEREVGSDPEADIKKAVKFLNGIILGE